MQTKELRFALVCYGGVSLAVYMHGLTKEVWKLVRASMRRRAPPNSNLPPARDSESVYQALLDHLPGLELRVICDIVAGASAGGINAVLLSRALVEGHDLDAIRSLWLDGADSDVLLDPNAASRPLSKLWAVPLVWWTIRRGLETDDKAEVRAHAEVKRKLSRFMRSRWFQPPFSGLAFSRLLADGFKAMEDGERSPPLVPHLHPFNLFVTVTDYRGAPQRLSLHSPLEVTEPEHRLVMGFTCPGEQAARTLGDKAALIFAARATASFPGAFPPARATEIDALIAERNEEWPGREAFLGSILPNRINPATVDLIDGAVLDNRPFGPALAALARRPATREVDRRFVYLDPKPRMHDGEEANDATPGFFSTLARSLSDIPRQQPIRDSLSVIELISARARRLRYIIVGMLPMVETAIDGAIGIERLLVSPSAKELGKWRSQMNSQAVHHAGFLYGAYGRLKLSMVVDALALRVSEAGGQQVGLVRQSIWDHLRKHDMDNPDVALGDSGTRSSHVLFLRRFDLDFRVRRLRFVIRRVNMAIAEADDETAAILSRIKGQLHSILAPHLVCGRSSDLDDAARAACTKAEHDPAIALSAMADAMDLQALDQRSDSELVRLLGTALPEGVRRDLLSAYLGFPFFDIATLPMIADGGLDELDEIKVDRISPDDAPALAHVGGRALKGALFRKFGAFFSRAYREHDYLWGRLHGAERMIDLVVSSVPTRSRPDPETLARLRREVFRAIVAAERPHLRSIKDTIRALEVALEM